LDLRASHPVIRMSLDEIRSNFTLLDDWEDRYRYVIELGRMLPPLDEALKSDATKVRGCASQVWLISLVVPDDGDAPRLAFQGDSDAHIVRGLIAILLEAVEGKTAAEIVATDLPGIFAELGLKDNLTPQRSNGLASMIARIRTDAAAAAAT
jgi:cysteine desulfuration protein SufE